MRRRPEQLVGGSSLDEPPRIHHQDAHRQVRHDGQVVRDVQRSDAVHAAQLADGPQHLRLRPHIEAGRRLVEHDELRAQNERHGDRHALLLATRELMGEAPQERLVRRQVDVAQCLADPLGDRRLRRVGLVELEELSQLRADSQRRVQRRRRILGHVGDGATAQSAQLRLGEGQDVATVDADGARGDARPAPYVAEERNADRRLARARLPDEPHHLARLDLELDVVDDVDA
jgi:hypothetical protein